MHQHAGFVARFLTEQLYGVIQPYELSAEIEDPSTYHSTWYLGRNTT
jgi:hypothetical protein